jgi:hypothetical protein
MVTKDQLVKVVEVSIDDLLSKFKNYPYFFYTENDLHTYLYFEIFKRLPQKEWVCKTQDGKNSILLHKEYPTKERYSAKLLQENFPKGSRGHFDLTIWNPEKTQERFFRANSKAPFESEQQTFIAIELDMIEGSESLDRAIHHFKWDTLKLKSKKNEIEHGYSLVFVRDWRNSPEFISEIIKIPQDNKITIIYSEVKKEKSVVVTLTEKPFLYYEKFCL